MAITQTHSRPRSVSPETLSRLKYMDGGRRHPGHAHFWDRALSRRGFLQTTGAAAGALVLGSSAWTPAWAKPHDATPNPVPAFINGPHVFTGPDTDRSSIFDFDGDIGYAVVDGTGVGRDTSTGVETAYDYEVDLRFMQGKFIGKDGKHHHGTFCLI